MKAIAVLPGVTNSVHLRELARPAVGDVPGGRGVLVRVLRVGVDGTDKEINAAEYGAAPPGDDYLIIGHESFGQVEAVGPNVTELRPGSSIYDQIGTYDVTTDDIYFELGVKDMAQAEAQYPGWLARLLMHPVKGLENYKELFDKLTRAQGAIKVFCEVADLI